MHVDSWPHLAARFFDVLLTRPLDPGERRLVDGWLRSNAEKGLFWSQTVSDQRHGLAGAVTVSKGRPDRSDLIRAALLHDVGKQKAHLGVIGRTVAALATKVSVSVPGRLGDHLRHDHIGAWMLLEAGCEPTVVEFARYHHSERPVTFSTEDWDLLRAADRSSMFLRTKP